MFSWPTQPGGTVSLSVPVLHHLAGSRPLLPLLFPLLPFPSCLSPCQLLTVGRDMASVGLNIGYISYWSELFLFQVLYLLSCSQLSTGVDVVSPSTLLLHVVVVGVQ